jgi:hypothetical protein
MKAMIPSREFELRKAQAAALPAALPAAAIRGVVIPGGGGYPGGGGRGGHPSGGQQNSGQDIEDNPRMQSLIHPSALLSIEVKTPKSM